MNNTPRTELLVDPEDRGFPSDYLMARIRARKTSLISRFDDILYSESPAEYLLATRYREHIAGNSREGVWQKLLTEYSWVYSQMNNGLRTIFWPFFLHMEIKTILYCLRYRLRKETEKKISRILSRSLLSERIKKVLTREDGLLQIVREIEKAFILLSDKFYGVGVLFQRDGLEGIERMLPDTYLEYITGSDIHPQVRSFFSYTIDSRNIIALYKNLRWGIRSHPPFIEGGKIRRERIIYILKTGDIHGIYSLVRMVSGIELREDYTSEIVAFLYRGLKKILKRKGRDPLGTGSILDYLWRCYLEAVNLRIILYGYMLERDTIEPEIVS
jgi:vacuolar-type H+-ATPase subunit C/Vma6